MVFTSHQCAFFIGDLVGFTMVFGKKNAGFKYPLIGLILGFSFLFRYQIAFAGIGLVVWLILVRKIPLKQDLALIASGFLIVFIGILID